MLAEMPHEDLATSQLDTIHTALLSSANADHLHTVSTEDAHQTNENYVNTGVGVAR